MAAPWSTKGSKNPPLVSLDEFLILDSADANLATKNKRVTLATVQANLVTSVDANDFNITKLNSISINDSANNNTFTISSNVNLAADRTINLPLLTADDTFAMLGAANIFTQDNIFESCVQIRSNVPCTTFFTTVAANTGLGGRLVSQLSRGTIAVPLDVEDGDRIYTYRVTAYEDGFKDTAFMDWNVDGDWTATNHGSSLTIGTTPVNTIQQVANIIIKNKVISFEDNDLDNIKSLNVTLPVSTVAEGLSIGNTDGKFVFANSTSTANEFSPLMTIFPKGSSNPFFTDVFIDPGDDTGNAALSVLNVGTTSGSIANRPLWQLQNSNVTQVSVAATGDWNFVGNNITNAVIQSNLTNGSILVGNESNVSEDFSAKLQTKADCLVATTVPGTLTSSFETGDVIDTVTLDTGDRILIKDQTDASENGIYTVSATGAPTRAADANQDSEVNNGMFTKITSGSANINTAFVLVTPDTPTIVLDTTFLTFDEFSFSDIAHLNEKNIFTNPNNIFFDTLSITPNVIDDTRFFMDAVGSFADFGAIMICSRSRGTLSNPTAILDGDALFELALLGFDGVNFVDCGNFTFQAAGDFTETPANRPCKFTITTHPANSATASSPARLVIGSEGETSFQDNIIQDIKSIKLNDASDTNSYTILGAELANDFDVTIPTVTASDTFAMLGVNNTFTGANTWTDDLVQLEDNTLQNANFKGEVYSTSTVQQTSFQGFRAAGTKAIPAATTSGSVFVDLEAVGFDGTIFSVGGSAGFIASATWSGTSTPTTFSIFTTDINSITNVENLVIGADGTADFKGNNIINAVIQSTLTDGSILIGNENNVSEDFPTGLETKIDCRVATTTANIDLTSSINPNPIDGITLVNGDRILLKNQTDTSQNGIYVAVIAIDPDNWVRSGDANTDLLVNNGMFTKITEGTLNGNTAFVLSTPDPIAVNSTDLTFDEFSFADIAHLNEPNQTFTEEVTFDEAPQRILDGGATFEAFTGNIFTNDQASVNGFRGFRARGSKATPLPLLNNTSIVAMDAVGFNGMAFDATGFVQFTSGGNWSPTSEPTRFSVFTTDTGTTSTLENFSIEPDGTADFKENAISNVGTLDYTNAIATIATGVLTTTVTYQSVAGEGAAADDLVTITAGTTGQYLIIRPSDDAVTITVKSTGNIVTVGGNDFVMDDIEDTMTLIYDGTNWIEISRNVAPNSGKRQIFLYHSSNTNLDSILLGAGSLSTTGTATAVLDADGYYVNYEEGGMGAEPDIICIDVTRRSHNFDLTFKIRAPATVDRRLWFGYFTADPSGSNTPVAAHIGLRVSTDAGNTGFVLSHADGITQAETVLAPADTEIHTLRIIADDSNTEFRYSFDGAALVSVSTNIPASATNLDFYSIGTNLGVPLSQFDFWFLNGFADV